MKNNKIYMTLAHLFNQIKGVIGDSGRTLNEEIDHRVANQQEVIDARKGYKTLLQKVTAIDDSIDGTNTVIRSVEQRVSSNTDSIENVQMQVTDIKNSNPVVELENGEHLLVALNQRPTHKSTNFSLNAGEKYRTTANTQHYVSNLYVRDNIHNKEIDMSFKADNSTYDSTILDNVNGSLYGIFTKSDILPFHNILIANQSYDNLAVVPGLCTIQGISASPYVNENNHVTSAFKTGYTWHLKAKMSEVIFTFIKPIEITDISFIFTANTLQQTVAASKLVNDKWVEITRVDASDLKLDVNEKLSSMKLTFSALSESDVTRLEISNIIINVRHYQTESGIARVTELVDLYDLSGFATLAPIIDIPTDTVTKYAIHSAEDSDEVYTFYPSVRSLESGLFKDRFGNYVLGDITSNIRDSYVLDYNYRDFSIQGNEGRLTLGSHSWSEDSTVNCKDGFNINPLTYFNLYVTVKSTEHVIQLNQNHLNKVNQFTIEDVTFEVELKEVKGALKFKVTSPTPLPSVRASILNLQNVFGNGNGSSIRPSDSSTVSIRYDNVNYTYNLDTVYNCYKGHYSWEQVWINSKWVWQWVYKNSSYSKYNQSQKQSIVFVDNNRLVSNPARNTLTSVQQYDIHSFVLANVTQATGYVGNASLATAAFLEDGEIVTVNNTSEITGVNEFIGHMKIDRSQKILNITPDDICENSRDIEYFVSSNNYNFYVYNSETNGWVQSRTGMTSDYILGIPPHAFEKLFVNEDVFIKVRINRSTAVVKGVNIEFDKSKFNSIPITRLEQYGMNTSDLKDISAEFILELINRLSTISVIMASYSKAHCWQLAVPGIQLIEYGGISWKLDTGQTATQHVSGNMLIVTNTANEMRHYRLEQKYFEDMYVSVGDKAQMEKIDQMETKMATIEENATITDVKVDILDQNVQLLDRAMDSVVDNSSDYWHGFGDDIDNVEKPSFDLPTFIIPSQIEVDLEPLAPGDSTEIKDIKNLRYIQFWDTQLHPVPEFVENKTIKDLQHHFIHKYGAFTQTHYEMEKYYDTDNAYLMTRSVSSASTSKYTTPEYTCTSKYADGSPCAVYGGGNLNLIMNYNRDGSNTWHGDYAMASMAYFSLPGEEKRWVDIDIEFNTLEYVHGLLNMDFNCRGRENELNNANSYGGPIQFRSYQQTIILLDIHGDGNWIEHKKYTGLGTNINCIIDKEVKKIRIRLEVPYSNNRGSGQVSLKYFDIYYCPIRYVHDVNAMIKPILYYSTDTWERLLSVYSDATIYGTSTDIRYLFETNNRLQNNPEYWSFDGSSLVKRADATYANGMTLYAFNNLTEEQLKPLLQYQYVRPVAILDSVDGHHTAKLRTLRMNYSEKNYETTTLLNPQDVQTRYDSVNQKVIVTNATQSNKTLKAIIS